MSNALIVKPSDIASVTASGTASGYDPAYVGNDHMGVVWKSDVGASKSFTVDLGADVLCDTAMLLGCTGATSGWTLKVDANTAAYGASFTTPQWSGATLPFLAGAEMPVNGRGNALWQAPVSPPPASRYWRFTIAGMGGGGQAVVARLVLGPNLLLERNFSYGAQFGVKDFGSIKFSRRGVMLRQRGSKLRSLNMSLNTVRKNEIEALVLPLLERIGNTEGLAILTDPDAHAMRQRRMYFGPLIGDLLTIMRTADGYSAGLNLLSLI
ncbi:hypothetical protein O4H52_03055 [Sphingomonadaceae bacterium G21617-S1]|nr:hypothetical protein [Sphingomonadaceae bacterium G21617-S1]